MSVTLRQFAVSGSAAVALLGGAAAITVAESPTASAATHTVAHSAVTAPVRLPDGRTVRITGMGGYGHTATADHIATVAAYKTGNTGGTSGVGTGLTPDGGVGAAITSPVNGQQTGVNQQIVTQSSGGYIGAGIVGILLLTVIVFFRVKHKHLHVGDAIVGGLLGIAAGSTVFGTMGHQLINSAVGSIGSMLSSLG